MVIRNLAFQLVLSCGLISGLLGSPASAKSKPNKKTPAPSVMDSNKPMDRAVVFTTREADLLKPKFVTGLESTADQLMRDPSLFFSISDAVKISRVIETNKETDLLVRVVDVAIESYDTKKKDHLFEIENTFKETVSAKMKPKEAAEFLREKIGRKSRVVRVLLLIEKDEGQ